ncbi:MAG: AsmA family protein [Planctomycetes bacterium]|nr:AsmA family protein [Planctomycetota bacterium]
MKKLKLLIIGGILLVIIAAVALHFATPSLLREGIQRGGTAALGTDVELEAVSISAFSGEASLQGLRIDNLEGFAEPDFMKADRISVEVQPWSLLGSPVKIGAIVLEKPVFTLEASMSGTNFTKLLDRLSGDGKSSEGEPAPAAKSEAGATELQIEMVRIDGGQVIVAQSAWGKDAKTLELAPIEIRDLSSEDGKSTTDLAGLMGKIVAAVLEQVATKNDIPPELITILKQDIGKSGVVKDIIDEAKDLGGGVQKTVDEAGKILDVFKKKN